MTPVESTIAGANRVDDLMLDRRHAVWKAAISLVLAGVCTVLLVLPGWATTQYKPMIPEPPTSVLGLGFIDALPDSDQNDISLSLDTRQAGPMLNLSLQVEQPDEFTAKPVLVMSSDIGQYLRGCTGVGFSTSRDLSFEQLQPSSQAIVNAHWEETLSRESLDDAPVSELEIAEHAQRSQYVEVQLETEAYQYSINYGQNDPRNRSIVSRKTERDCQFEKEAFWISDGPFHGLSIPRMAVAYPTGGGYSGPRVDSNLEAKITDLGVLSLTQSSSAPGTAEDGSPVWKPQTSASYGNTVANFRVKDSRPVGVAFRSATQTQSDQVAVFLAGIGVGLAGSLLVLALPLIYDTVFVLSPAIKKARQADVPGPDEPRTAPDSEDEEVLI